MKLFKAFSEGKQSHLLSRVGQSMIDLINANDYNYRPVETMINDYIL